MWKPFTTIQYYNYTKVLTSIVFKNAQKQKFFRMKKVKIMPEDFYM